MNGNASSTVLSGHANQRNLSDMTLTELQEIAMRQQQQIEINQQLLHAKEKRLKSLKQEDTKQYQMITQQQQQQPQPQSTKDMQKLEALKQSVLSQELKIFKLKQLRNQILEYKLSNANMYSELDLIKSLFDQKERELFGAISKVAELSKQIEQLRKLKQKNNHQNSAALNTSQDQQQAMSAASSHITELERLKQELQIRNKLNEQQAKKIITQQDQFNKKQIEVLALDKRIEELKDRIAAKRNYLAATNNQQLTAAPQQQQQHIQAPPQPPPHAQIHPHPYHHYNQNVPPNNLASNVRTLHTPAFDSAPQQLPQQQQQSQSPSKLVAKFATKQEIANTYMNKYNSDAYQKYQARMFQQQQQQQQQHSPSSAQHSPQVADQQQQQIKPSIEEVLGETGAAQSSSYSAQSSSMSISSNAAVNGTAPTTANAARPESSSSSLVSLSPISNASNNLVAQQQTVAVKGCRKASYDAPSQSQLAFMMANNAKLEDSSTLPSHLKLEFDKIKYLPDVVKTIKKRHSISEIESSNTLPPQIFQKILEKHHKNFLDQHGSLTDQMLVAPSSSSSNSTIAQASKLNKITEVSETAAPSPTQPAQQQQSPPQQQQQSNQQVKLSTFMPQTAKQPQVQTQQQQQQQQQLPQIQPTEQIEVIESTTIKSTKSIIKTTPSSTQLSTDATESNTITASRRVNFDPHALLLDAAVEGELELVMRCAKQVRDISQPNDEGITALHNSVCAGHFGIVKFLVEYGCDINYADNDGWTPLHCAASCNNLQMIRFLIENGASLFATTLSDNETAIRKCEEDEEGFQPCYEYLAQAQEQLGNDGGFVYSLYDYEAQNEDELTFTCNQRLVVVDKCEGEDDANDGWWLCRLDNGQEGLVPKNYLGLYPRVRPGCESRAQEESTIC